MDVPDISRALPEEAPALTRIAHSAKRSWGYPADWIRAWQAELTLDRAYVTREAVYCIREDGAPVGFYALIPGRRPEEWELDHVWVAPDAMGRGYGRALVAHAMRQAATRGATEVRLLSDPNAEQFYQRLGAKRVGQVEASIDGQERWLPEMILATNA